MRSKVDSGKYESASEVIRDSLRALQERDQSVAEFWAQVREKVAVARQDIADGHTYDGEETMKQLMAEFSDTIPTERKKKRPR